MRTSILNISHLSVWLQVETATRNFAAYWKVLPYVDFAAQVQTKFKMSAAAWNELLNRYEA